MKILILFSVVAVVKSAVIPAPAVPVVAAAPARLVETGNSRVQRTEDNLGNYAFGYDEIHTTGGSFRREQTSPTGGVTGSYGLRDADGRLRTVNYIADEAGFRVAITTNEPGTESKNTAGALFNSGEIPPGPVVCNPIDCPQAAALLAVPTVAAAAPAPIVAPARVAHTAPIAHHAAFAPARLSVPAHLAAPAQLVAPAPARFAAPVAAAPLLAPAQPPVHGPGFLTGPPSAPVLAPGATPTVLSNPLIDGSFAQFARPAISTPQALTTGPLAAPLNHFAPAPLATPAVATQAFAPTIPTHGHIRFAAPAALAAPVAPAYAAPIAAPVAAAPVAVSGMAYQTEINHQIFNRPFIAAPAGVKY